MAGAAATVEKAAAPAQPKMKVAVTTAKKPDYVEGRRSLFKCSLFKYRDLGITGASEG